jgi:hypothetical protein
MKVKFEVKMLKMSAVEMTIMRKIGDFPHAIGKAFSKHPGFSALQQHFYKT